MQLKNKLLLVLIVFIAVIGCTSSEKNEGDNTLQRINEEVLANSHAYNNLEKITSEIGHRLTGSENGKKAEQYTYDLLKSYGFTDVKFHQFEVEAWARDTVAIDFNGVDDKNVVSLGHSPVFADTSAQLVDVGNGLRVNFESLKEQVSGKIVLAYIGLLDGSSEELKNIHRSEKTALAIEYGARGIVIINQVPNGVLLTGTASVTGSLIPIPAVCITYEKGMELKRRLEEGEDISAHLFMKNKSEVIKSRNVVATLEGSTLKNENIVIGGHLDSWDLATGAIDNGIGIAAVLDMARTFSTLGIQPKRTIQFVMFMGEEQGLLGSKALVKQLAEGDNLGRISYMMNIDMSGNPKGFNASGRANMVPVFDAIGEKISQVDSSYQNENSNKAGLHSDHQTYMMEGVPVVGLVGDLEPIVYDFYHSNGDDFELVNEQHLKNTVRFSSMMLYELSTMENIPAKKLDFEQTKEFLIDQGLREELELGNEWKWGE
ncbi:MAG: carboxypeptidase Q [Marivirga sp.]|jgi:carboxypeptidase Q